MLHLYDIFLESETDSKESFHNLKCHRLVHLFSASVSDENGTILSFFEYTKTLSRYFFHIITKYINIVDI